jgi:hypothetical protein
MADPRRSQTSVFDGATSRDIRKTDHGLLMSR